MFVPSCSEMTPLICRNSDSIFAASFPNTEISRKVFAHQPRQPCLESFDLHWNYTVADPGFPVGGAMGPLGGRGPPTQALFGENVCENERNGSHRGWRVPGTPPPDPPMLHTLHTSLPWRHLPSTKL